MIVIVDYGIGNLASVAKAIEFLKKPCKFTDSLVEIKKAEKIILPGVGHFGQAVKELKKRKLFDAIKARIKDNIPFLGICVGMQLLFESSQEAKGLKGLGVIKGEVKKFDHKKIIVPHMGWNKLEFKQQDSGLFNNIPKNAYVYFANSYYCSPEDKSVILATTNYGINFTSAIYNNKNLWAVQFHPEKSQSLGLKILNNFLQN